MRRILTAFAAVLTLAFLAPIAPAQADGSETLGPPSIPIATGTGIAAGGVGLDAGQPKPLEVNVPLNATVKQVLLYWEGRHIEPDMTGDNTINVDGNEITGQTIGGPAPLGYTQNGEASFSTSFRADITSRGLVTPGANTLWVGGLTFNQFNDGAGILVIYSDGSEPGTIQVRDGNDFAYHKLPGSLSTTAPQSFTVAASAKDRDATLNLQVGNAGIGRPTRIRVTVDATTTDYDNLLGSKDGPQWDSLDLPIKIPAGATAVTVQILSEGGPADPASLAWVAATLSTGPATKDPCSAPSNTPAETKGSAYAVDATVLNLHPVTKMGLVNSQAPGDPSEQARQFAGAHVENLVSAGLLTTQSNSSLDPSTTTSSAQVADVSLLNGLVKATAVEGVSQSVASTSGATYNSTGSKIVGLTVNNTAVAVAPNTKVAVKSLGMTVAELHVYEESGTSTYANGVSKSSHQVNMLRLVLLQPLLGFPKGTQVIVGHAESGAQSPTVGCPGLKSVSGEAFTAYVDGNVAGRDFVEVKVGDAVLPSTGGQNSDGTNVGVPGVATSSTASNTTSGSLSPNPSATSRSVVESVNVLNGLITADVLDVSCVSSADGSKAGTTFATTFVNLKVGQREIERNPAPNRHVIVPLPTGGYASVVINEQTVNGNGTKDTEGTVNALHVRIYTPKGLLEGELIIASAHCDAHSQ